MSSANNWKYPDWIYAAQHKLQNIDTSKFLFPVHISHSIVRPKDNKYIREWAIVVKLYIDAKDRINGGKLRILSSNEGIYIYRSSDIEDVIFEELTVLINHELKECFQIRELRRNARIPFDPHKANKYTTLYAYRKVNHFPHYPSFRAYVWAGAKRFFKLVAAKMVALMHTPKSLTSGSEAATIDVGIKVTESK